MKDKICSRCRLVIGPDENYIHLEEYNNKKKIGECDYHKKCFEDKNYIKKLAAGLAMRTHGLLNRAEGITQ